MTNKSIEQKGYYWCLKCGRMHKKSKGKLFKKHLEFAQNVSEQELRNLQFRRHWNQCAQESAKFGAVNLPKKEKKRSQRFARK